MKTPVADIKAIIFDFDGTLVDVESLMINIFNALSLEFGYTRIELGEVPLLKQLGAKQFIWQKLRWSFWKFPRIIRRGREEYKKSLGRIDFFPDMQNVMWELSKRGYRVGVLSSNTTQAIQEFFLRYDVKVDFLYQSTLFGKAQSLEKALREEKLSTEEVLYIGDEIRDIEACRKCHVDILSVTWGLNTKEALQNAGAETADTPQEILDKLPSKL